MEKPSDPNEPRKCPECFGIGHVFRWNIKDQRYPVPCLRCRGQGTQ